MIIIEPGDEIYIVIIFATILIGALYFKLLKDIDYLGIDSKEGGNVDDKNEVQEFEEVTERRKKIANGIKTAGALAVGYGIWKKRNEIVEAGDKAIDNIAKEIDKLLG